MKLFDGNNMLFVGIQMLDIIMRIIPRSSEPISIHRINDPVTTNKSPREHTQRNLNHSKILQVEIEMMSNDESGKHVKNIA